MTSSSARAPAREVLRVNVIVGRARARLSQEELADRAGISRPTLSRRTRGGRRWARYHRTDSRRARCRRRRSPHSAEQRSRGRPRSWRDVRPHRKTSLSTPTRFSKPSTKPPDGSNATAGLGDRPWRVRLHREVQKVVALHGQDSDVFRPSIGQLVDSLKSNPKQFPKKRGTRIAKS